MQINMRLENTLKKCGCQEIINEIHQVWEEPHEMIPNYQIKFVLKMQNPWSRDTILFVEIKIVYPDKNKTKNYQLG